MKVGLILKLDGTISVVFHRDKTNRSNGFEGQGSDRRILELAICLRFQGLVTHRWPFLKSVHFVLDFPEPVRMYALSDRKLVGSAS